MTRKYSNWYIPPDWCVLLGFHLVLPTVAVITAGFLIPARHGDPTLLFVAVGLGCVGIVLLFCARLPLYRQKRFFTFGPAALDGAHRKLYWAAYACIVPSILLLLVLALLWR